VCAQQRDPFYCTVRLGRSGSGRLCEPLEMGKKMDSVNPTEYQAQFLLIIAESSRSLVGQLCKRLEAGFP
jgi:hypothetical protein